MEIERSEFFSYTLGYWVGSAKRINDTACGNALEAALFWVPREVYLGAWIFAARLGLCGSVAWLGRGIGKATGVGVWVRGWV